MSRINTFINNLKEMREQAISLQNELNIKRANNDIDQFYEDSLKVSNMNDGMVVIILKDKVIKEKAPNGLSHRKVAQDVFDSLPLRHIDLSKSPGDFGDDIAKEYDCIFIRLVSILNGSSIIYCPEECNEFQIAELEKFNQLLRTFNANKKDIYKADVLFKINDYEGNSIDELIEMLKEKKQIKKST